MTEPALPLGDYVSPNLARVLPDAAFPHMIVGNPDTNSWPHLRRRITHNWYIDRRTPTVGFVSRDEASILYNTARLFDGLASLEIGCWRGWSTVHIALGTHSLDAIDPILADPATREELTETLRHAGVQDRVSLVGLSSPEAVEKLAAETGKRWSFAFIDGDHSGEAPIADVEVVQRFAARDALIILHDLAAPEPAAALEYLRDRGWTTAIYQTMQIMGVATRGRCRPVAHVPDPAQQWSLPAHLSTFAVIGESAGDTTRRIIVALGGPERRVGSENQDDETRGRADIEEALIAASAKASWTKNFDDLHARYVSLVDTLAAQSVTREALATELAEAGRAREAALAARDHAIAETQRIRTDHTRLANLLDRSMRSLAAVDRRLTTHQSQAEEFLEMRVAVDALRAREAMSRAAEAFAHAICQPRVLLGLGRRAALGSGEEVRRIVADAFFRYGSPIPLPTPAVDWLSSPRTLVGLLRRRVLAGGLAAEGLLARAIREHVLPEGGPQFSSEIAVAELRDTLARLAAEQRRTQEAEQKAQELARKLKGVETAMVAEERSLYEAQLELARLRAAQRKGTTGSGQPPLKVAR